jgi:HK97 family phage major capsid protein
MGAMTTLAEMLERLEQLAGGARAPSRHAGTAATPDHVEWLAGERNYRLAPPSLRTMGRRESGLAAHLVKALAEGTGSAGGYLVPVEIAAEVLTLLRARSTVMSFARVVPVKKELRIVSLVESASAEYASENEPIPISEQTFGEAPMLRPKRLSALVPVSNRLLRDAAESPDADAVIREDLAAVMALRADRAFLLGDGPDPEPVGIFNSAGVTPGPDMGTNGSAPDYDTLKETAALLRAQNAPFQKPGWIFHPRTLATFDQLKDSSGRYLSDTGLLSFDAAGGGGTLLGWPFRTSTQIPIDLTAGSSTDCSLIFFSSDWQECWIGENERFEIQVSSEAAYVDGSSNWHSAFQSDQSLFRASTHHDLGLRRPELFVVVEGVRG